MPINIVDDATLQYAELTFHYANDRDALMIGTPLRFTLPCTRGWAGFSGGSQASG